LEEGKLNKKFEGQTSWVRALQFIKERGYLACASDDKTIRLWNVKEGKLINTLQGHTGPVVALAYIKNGYLASGSCDKTIKLWNLKE